MTEEEGELLPPPPPFFFLPSSQGPAAGKVFTSYIGGGGFFFMPSRGKTNGWAGKGETFTFLAAQNLGEILCSTSTDEQKTR